jgi:hypothetical protein
MPLWNGRPIPLSLLCVEPWSDDGVNVNERTKVPLVLVAYGGVEPRLATQHDVGSHGDSFESDRSEQIANRRVRFTGANRDEDAVALIRVQMRLASPRY